MFSRLFIELIFLYRNINNYSSNMLGNEKLLTYNTFENNLFKVDETLHLIRLYKNFIEYYEGCILNYF